MVRTIDLRMAGPADSDIQRLAGIQTATGLGRASPIQSTIALVRNTGYEATAALDTNGWYTTQQLHLDETTAIHSSQQQCHKRPVFKQSAWEQLLTKQCFPPEQNALRYSTSTTIIPPTLMNSAHNFINRAKDVSVTSLDPYKRQLYLVIDCSHAS